MFGAMGFEVSVAGEIVGEEAKANLKGDEFAAEGEELSFGWSEKASGGGQIAADEGFKDGHAHGDLGKVSLVFGGWAGGGADHVAEIVENEAGHDGVEVDDAEGFACLVVEQDVVELGVVVGDALG